MGVRVGLTPLECSREPNTRCTLVTIVMCCQQPRQEPIEVEVAVHNAGSLLRPKKLTAAVLQYVDGWVDGREIFRRVTFLDKSKHYPKVCGRQSTIVRTAPHMQEACIGGRHRAGHYYM